jgi:putative copper export protein/methionine-rich copper-binding protein CopC
MTSTTSEAWKTAWRWCLGALVACGFLLMPNSATAQTANSLQSIEPADGTSLAVSPTVITLSFNQELADDDALTLSLACNNELQNTGLPEVDPDGLIVTVAVNTPVPRGTCFVSWFLKDGLGATITQSTSSFGVTSDPPAGAIATVTTTTDPFIQVPAVTAASSTTAGEENPGSTGGALWLGRMLSTLGILVIFGSLTLISIGWPEGPEYVVTVRFLRAVWLVALLGTVLYLIAFAADFAGTSFGAAMSPSAWLDLKDAGWEGRGALLRLVFVAASGWVAMRPERIIDPQSAMLAWGIPGAALVTVALSRVSGPAAPIGFLVGVAHVLAVAIWFGGAALVARVVLAGPGEEDLVQATRAFSRVSVPAMLVAAISGVIQVIRLDGGELFSSSHGRVVLLKVIAVAAMLAVAIAARQQVALRLDRAHELTVPLADRFRRAFGAEAALGVVVLAFSGWMLTLTPASVDPYAGEVYLPALAFNDEASGLEAKVFIGPGTIGLNGLKVEVEQPPDGITNFTLRFVPPVGSNAFTVQQAIPLTTWGTAILMTSEGLPFNVPGTWTLELSASTATGVIENATYTFAVTDANGQYVTIPPNNTGAPVQTEVIDQTTTTAPFATTPPTAPPSAPGTTDPAG